MAGWNLLLLIPGLLSYAPVQAAQEVTAPVTQSKLAEAENLWQELRSSPIFARDAVRTWRGEYRSFGAYQIPETGVPENPDDLKWAQYGDGPKVSRFELAETSFGPDHHIRISPIEHAPEHNWMCFARGMQFWKRADDFDVIVYEDQRLADWRLEHHDMRLRPRGVPSPLRFLTELLAPGPEIWADKLLGLWNNSGPRPIGALGPVQISTAPSPPGHEHWIAIRQIVTATEVLMDGKPVVLTRDIFYDPELRGLPVRVEMFAGERLRHRWRFVWVPADPMGSADPAVRGHRLVRLESDSVSLNGETHSTTVFELTAAKLLTEQQAAQALMIKVPAGFRVLDRDPLNNN